jgi:radical SAM superfamily enzyme YgiQ (UPF0313 family)
MGVCPQMNTDNTDSRVDSSVSPRRVLLVYANEEREPWPIMPIGLGFVAAALDERGHHIHFVDLVFEDDWPGRLHRAVEESDPEIVGISIRNADNVDWYDLRTYLDRIRDEAVTPLRAVTDAPIVVGGSAVNITPGRITELVRADGAVYGDGEQTFRRIVETFSPSTGLPALEGFIPRGGSGQGVEPCRIEALSEVSQPRLHRWVDAGRYLRAGSSYPVQTKRGCALDCSFCVYGRIEGRGYRLHDPEAIADEIEEASRSGIRDFEFTDSMFNIPVAHAIDVCRAIINRKLDVGLNSSGVHPGHFSAELMDVMELAGFEQFSFAPDSASPTVLSRLGKGYTTTDVLVEAANRVRGTRMKVMWWLTLGLPGETAETIEETLSFIRGHVRPGDLVLCSVGVRIFHGTRLAKIAIEEGRLDPGADLVQPFFYEPVGISLNEIDHRLRLAAAAMPNLVLNSQARSFTAIIRIGTWLKRVTGHHKPIWAPLPFLNGVQSLPRRIARGIGLV